MSGAGLPSPVAVVGLGVMGGSLVRALRSSEHPPEIVGASPEPRDLDGARAAGLLDRWSADPDEVAGDADLVVYATPLHVTAALFEAHRERWRAGAVITDVASLKAPLAERVRELGLARRWVGSHPMAGSEGAGFEASRDGLFDGAPVWLCDEGAAPRARDAVEALWRAVGARPAWTEPAAHDRLMTWASHLPQLASNALAAALDGAGLAAEALGPGGRDATRLAASSPTMWRDLLEASARADATALRALEREVSALADLLERGDADAVAARMAATAAWRRGDDPATGRRP